jgi:hypothetical protein
MDGEKKRHLETFQTLEAQNTVLKLRDRLAKKKRNQADIDKLSALLLGELEPWMQLAMVGQIYARYLDSSDLVVSEDPLLLRKHEFIDLGPKTAARQWFPESELSLSSEGEGSFFAGGLAKFSLSAGWARARGNHLGGNAGDFVAGALIASIRATDWRTVTQPEVRAFGATVRLAREWIVESGGDTGMYRQLEQATLGVLSLVRRKSLLEAVQSHSWSEVWQSASISDLHFLGDALLESAPPAVWNNPSLQAMKKFAAHSGELDALGPLAPELSGCAQPRLRRYEPYEEFQRYFSPVLLAQRLSELKLYLASMADDAAWEIDVLPSLAARVADSLAAKQMMKDAFDWAGVLDSYRNLKAAELEGLWNH